MVPDRQTSPITFSVPSNGDIMAQPLSIALSMTEWMLGRRRREWLHSGGGMTGKDEVRDIFNGEIANGDLMVDVGALIEFFDVNVEARQDASSIKAILGEEIAIACMKRYFRDQKKSAGLVCVADKPGQRLACTTGGRKGFQLDGWFVVEEKGVRTCYQTEIKLWSIHGIGGGKKKPLITGPETETTLEQKRKIFDEYYDPAQQCLKQERTKKVLLYMRQPKSHKKCAPYPTQHPQALLCLWAPICQRNQPMSEIWFSVPVAKYDPPSKANDAICVSGQFSTLQIFSVSNYLRAALAEATDGSLRIALPLPRIAERMRILSAIFS
jgi:hypothetical protein